MLTDTKLAINGGAPVRTKPFHPWPVWDEREVEALKDVCNSGQWWSIGGRKCPEFEKRFATYHQARFGVCVPNGTIALEVSLRAAGVKAGDEVIVPPYTFIATASACLMVNAIPVFVDIDPDTYCIDPRRIEEAITEKTKAIIPVHIGGCPADMDHILSIARKHHLAVVEDAAQAHAAEWKGRRIGAIGDLGAFSFQASKNLNAGEGGIVLTDNEELYVRAWSVHNVGRVPDGAWYHHEVLGGNYRMTEWQAAILLAQLERLDEQTERRNSNALYLTSRLSEIEGIRPMKRSPEVTKHAYHLYIFRYDKEGFGGLSRADFLKALNAEGIPSSPGYVPLYREPAFRTNLEECPLACKFAGRRMDYTQVYCPVTEKACNEEGVWLFQSMLLGPKEDMDDIAEAIAKIHKAARS